MSIDRIEIKGFKSIRDQKIKISSINVLIGPNGVGKSNFIAFLTLIKNIYEQNLQSYIAKNGRAENFLYFGSEVTQRIEGALYFKNEKEKLTNSYKIQLGKTQEGSFIIEKEISSFNKGLVDGNEKWDDIWTENTLEGNIKSSNTFRDKYLRQYIEGFDVFHFHDTSRNSKLKLINDVKDNRRLRSDGSNLAAFLYMLSKMHPANFKLIERSIESVAPFFAKFDLEPDIFSPDKIDLVWNEKGSNKYFSSANLSDGTIRFIALSTLLLQPDPPKTIIIDEPELGLHPYAIKILTSLIKSVSHKCQVIISTQSVTLLNEFSPEDIIIVDRQSDGEREETVFKRYKNDDLKSWLEGYSLGEIWEKNLIGGRP